MPLVGLTDLFFFHYSYEIRMLMSIVSGVVVFL